MSLRSAPLGRLLGTSLDARQFTNLSTLTPETLITPADRFFIRTAAPPGAPRAGEVDPRWSVTIGGLVRQPLALSLDALQSMSGQAGRFVIECAGNTDTAGYGLMSAGDWVGVPLPALLDRVRPATSSHRVLVSGLDDETAQSRTSIPGASWIFSAADLQQAILALRLNGAALAPDHGAPVRLIVPNWYGCSCIKWVNRIELVPDEAAPTSQMVEYAGRTHQDESPALARDYTPAVVDTAAMPVRVEKWVVDGRLLYRVIGIVWGGAKPTSALAIRFRTGDAWVPVDDCPLPASTVAWSLWTHTWKPDAPGRYELVLKVTDPSIRTRRLDLFFYARKVDIDQV